MKKYITKHRWHLVSLLLLIIIAGVSGYFTLQTPNTNNLTPYSNNQTPQDKTQNTDGKIQDTHNNIQINISTTEDENDYEITSSTKISDTSPTTTSPIIPHPEPEFQNPITISVDGDEYVLEYQDNQTVYQFMQNLSADSKKPFIFSAKEYPGMGYFIDSINSIDNDNQSGKYWIYYINGQSATTGISNYIIQKNDKIEWKYESTNL